MRTHARGRRPVRRGRWCYADGQPVRGRTGAARRERGGRRSNRSGGRDADDGGRERVRERRRSGGPCGIGGLRERRARQAPRTDGNEGLRPIETVCRVRAPRTGNVGRRRGQSRPETAERVGGRERTRVRRARLRTSVQHTDGGPVAIVCRSFRQPRRGEDHTFGFAGDREHTRRRGVFRGVPERADQRPRGPFQTFYVESRARRRSHVAGRNGRRNRTRRRRRRRGSKCRAHQHRAGGRRTCCVDEIPRHQRRNTRVSRRFGSSRR